MKKVLSTGREEFKNELSDCLVIGYTKTTTKSDVFINGEIKADGESIGGISYEKGLNRFSLSLKKYDALTAEERASVVTEAINNINEMTAE